MSLPSAIEIANLLYRYAEYIDTGDLEGAAALFRDARIETARGVVGAAEVLESWRKAIILYEDGTPKTKHVITNPIIEVDEEAGTATVRSYYTVIQATDSLPLQPVFSGRYYDRFVRVDGVWRWEYRNYSLHDHPGIMSAHTRTSVS
jgi:3-phenylpropionate/cinnamic acid dioxygenase small subunit